MILLKLVLGVLAASFYVVKIKENNIYLHFKSSCQCSISLGKHGCFTLFNLPVLLFINISSLVFTMDVLVKKGNLTQISYKHQLLQTQTRNSIQCRKVYFLVRNIYTKADGRTSSSNKIHLTKYERNVEGIKLKMIGG